MADRSAVPGKTSFQVVSETPTLDITETAYPGQDFSMSQ